MAADDLRPTIPTWQADEKSTPLAQALLVRHAASEEMTPLEVAIDAAVYRLFGVAEEEIAVVESRVVAHSGVTKRRINSAPARRSCAA